MPPSPDGRIDVDVDAIEDFQPTFNRLDARAGTAHAKVGPASAQGLGQFTQAVQVITDHDRLRGQYMERLALLRQAVMVANQKTTTLIRNYRKTETNAVGNMTTFMAPLANIIREVRKD